MDINLPYPNHSRDAEVKEVGSFKDFFPLTFLPEHTSRKIRKKSITIRIHRKGEDFGATIRCFDLEGKRNRSASISVIRPMYSLSELYLAIHSFLILNYGASR